MKSVVIFAEDYLPNIGGIAAHVHNLAVGLKKAGVKVVVVTTRKDLISNNKTWWKTIRKERDGVNVVEIPMIRIPSPKNVIKNLQYRFRYASTVKRLIKENQATVFHWHNIFFDPEVAKYIKGKDLRKVFTNHSSQFLLAQRGSPQFLYNQRVIQMAGRIITPSTELLKETIKAGASGDKVTFISNGVNSEVFYPDPKKRITYREKLQLSENDVAIICPRRVVPKCGVVYFAKSLRYLNIDKKIKAFFLGLTGGSLTWRDEAYEKEVNQNLTNFGENIEVVSLPHIPSGEMPDYYRAMDICVLPSLIEATSISGLEAMSTALPLVATRVGGIPEIVSEGMTGFMVEPKDERALADRLNLLIGNRDLMKQMGTAGREKISKNFDWKIITQKTMQVYFDE